VTRKEFLKTWKPLREKQLEEMYRGEPHGQACLIMALTEVEADGVKLWRKYRTALLTTTPEELKTKVFEKGGAS
jgi:hypothetical protein